MAAIASTQPQSVPASAEKLLPDARPYPAGKTVAQGGLSLNNKQLADAKATFGMTTTPQSSASTAVPVQMPQEPQLPKPLTAAERRANEVLHSLLPTEATQSRRRKVMEYIASLVDQALKCEKVCAYGSVPLRTYLPEGDIDITALVTEEQPEWLTTLRDFLLEHNKRHEARAAAEEGDAGEEEEFMPVRDVQAINAEVRLLKCTVDGLVVDISVNSVGGLCTLCFLEEVDRGIGVNHLYKRSLLMIKAWCFYEARLLGAHHGLLSTYAVETLLLAVFLKFGAELRTPLQVMHKFLHVFSHFDWEGQCVKLEDMADANAATDDADSCTAQSCDGSASPSPSCSSASTATAGSSSSLPGAIGSCMEQYSPFADEIGEKYGAGRSFQVRSMNVVDPLQPTNNVGRSVSRANLFRIQRAFALGASQVAAALAEQSSKEAAARRVDALFANTLRRYGAVLSSEEMFASVDDLAAEVQSKMAVAREDHPVPVNAPAGSWSSRVGATSATTVAKAKSSVRGASFASVVVPPKLVLPAAAINLDMAPSGSSTNEDSSSSPSSPRNASPRSGSSSGSLSPSFFMGDDLLSISDFQLPTIKPPRVQEPLARNAATKTSSGPNSSSSNSTRPVAGFVPGCSPSLLARSAATSSKKVEFTGLCTKVSKDELSGDLPNFTTNLLVGIKAWQKVGPPTYPARSTNHPRNQQQHHQNNHHQQHHQHNGSSGNTYYQPHHHHGAQHASGERKQYHNSSSNSNGQHNPQYPRRYNNGGNGNSSRYRSSGSSYSVNLDALIKSNNSSGNSTRGKKSGNAQKSASLTEQAPEVTEEFPPLGC